MRTWSAAPHPRPPWLLPVIAAVALALVGSTTALVLADATPSGPAPSRTLGTHGSASSPSTPPGSALPTTTTTPLVVTTSPAAGATDVAPSSTVAVHFSAPLSPTSPSPTLSPDVPGTWVSTDPATLTFDPTQGLPSGRRVTVTVPGGPTGVAAAGPRYLTANSTVSFTVAPLPTHRLQELLAQLDYLPLSFTPTSTAALPAGLAAEDQPGSFAWRWTTLPATITSQWTEGSSDVITRGAVMAFEDQHHLTTDGLAGPRVWAALLAAAAAGQQNSFGHWDWVDVTTTLPETVSVWRDGAIAYQTPGNSGVPGATTALGTFEVFEHITSGTMTGTNPDGSKYSDPGIPWISYFNGGDALHGFDRASYGFPQSDGCIEMPPSNAAAVYPYTPIGTPVTVR